MYFLLNLENILFNLALLVQFWVDCIDILFDDYFYRNNVNDFESCSDFQNLSASVTKNISVDIISFVR